MCVSCGQREGPGAAEEHMFFTCPHAQEVWTRLQQTLAQSGGTFDPTSPADLTCTTAVTAMGGKGCTRVAWLGVGGGPVGHLTSAVRTERGADTGSEGEGWKHMVWGGVEGGDESQVGKGGADTHWKGAHGG